MHKLMLVVFLSSVMLLSACSAGVLEESVADRTIIYSFSELERLPQIVSAERLMGEQMKKT